MIEHYCPAEKTTISFEGECNWCGMREPADKQLVREFWSARQYQRLVKIFDYLLHPFKK